MNLNTMNRFIIFSLLCVALGLFACQETKEDLKNPVSEKDLYKTIGEEIPYETGMEWISFYRQQNLAHGRVDGASLYNLSSAQLTSVLESTAEIIGVAFHYAIDETGNTHILTIPLDGTLNLWSALPGRIYIDANSGEAINQDLAAKWAQNYKDAHPDEIWFHFFGKNIFDEMR